MPFCSWELKGEGEGRGGLACCAALRCVLRWLSSSMLPPPPLLDEANESPKPDLPTDDDA